MLILRTGLIYVIALLIAAQSPGAVAAASSSNAPVRQCFQISRYEITGSSVLSQPEVDSLTDDAVGQNVNLTEIRRALTRLQAAYRERGYAQASVTLPQQSLTTAVVHVRVFEGTNGAASDKEAAAMPAWVMPAYDVRHFEIHGNTRLCPEEIDRILGPAAGPAANLDQLHAALTRLRSAYRAQGLGGASVTLPQQLLTDGTIIIQVDEGLDPEPNAVAKAEQTVTPKPPAAPGVARTFEVRRYEVLGNTLLSDETIDQIFHQATGTNVSLAAIQKVVGDLQLAYRERGFATVGVGLPQQQLTNAVVKVQVTEGRLVAVRVTGNRHSSSNSIVRALPVLREALLWKDEVLNSRVFQSELDLANQNRDRQIYPTLSPGPEPGTSALELKVKDRFPLHGRMDADNYATPGTPNWRINAAAQYNNFWQLEHQMGLSYGFTPQEYKAPGLVPNYGLNQPLIAYGGAYYRMPFGSAESVQERINSSTRFGFDEATRQFRLPPAGNRPDLSVFASGSSSDTGVKLGPAVTVSQTPLLTIVSQDSGRDLSLNASTGARMNLPHALSDTRRFNFSGGLDWKFYELQSFNTNNFIITTIVTNSQGSQIIESRVSSPQPTRAHQVGYLPLALGADYFQTDPLGNFSANVGLSYNFLGDPAEFKALAYSRDASDSFGKATFALTRDQKIFKDWSLLLRASGQVATGPLINNEQFALGGINSVRGYYEGDEYGDAGWFGSAELRTPFLVTSTAGWKDAWPVWVRGSVFVDGGQRYLLDRRIVAAPTGSLLGMGFGLSANINNHMDVRVAVGWPLRDSINVSAYHPRVYFTLGGQF